MRSTAEVPKRRYSMTTRAASAAQTRERMLGAAFRLIDSHPYDEVTLQLIAQEAGVSAQTLILHFGSKEGLLKELILWWRPKEEAMRDVPEGDCEAAARALCHRYAKMGATTLRLLALEDQIESLRPLVDIGRTSHRAWVERTFGRSLHHTGAARQRRIMELVAVFDVYTWHVLRRVLSEEETIRAMAELARGVLGGEPKAIGKRTKNGASA
jgi:AcrR family transcriptional regulator